MVALAVSKGYSVPLAEAREHLKACAAAAGQVLSDADLDGLAGGSVPPPGGVPPTLEAMQAWDRGVAMTNQNFWF
jgi:hypothetical protein